MYNAMPIFISEYFFCSSDGKTTEMLGKICVSYFFCIGMHTNMVEECMLILTCKLCTCTFIVLIKFLRKRRPDVTDAILT